MARTRKNDLIKKLFTALGAILSEERGAGFVRSSTVAGPGTSFVCGGAETNFSCDLVNFLYLHLN